MRTNILYLYENEMPSVALIREAIHAKAQDAFQTADIVSFEKVTTENINAADVVILIRPTSVMSYRLARFAQKTKRFLIVNADDDLYGAPCDSVLNSSRVKWFRKVLHITDLLYTVSPRIAEKYKPLTAGKRSFVGDTSIEENEILPHVCQNEKVKIVYAAGLSHASMFKSYVEPILEDLYDAVGNVFSITFVGVHPELKELRCSDLEIRYEPMMPMDEYRRFMQRESFDIGLAPLHNDEFSKCKYFNKFFEYTRFGIVGVYADMEPYTYVIENRKNGMLAGQDSQEWLEVLKEVIEDQALRRQLMEASQQTLRDRFSYQDVVEKEKKMIPELYGESMPRKKINPAVLAIEKMEYKVHRMFLYLFTTIGYFRKNGFISLVDKVKSHIRHRRINEKCAEGKDK